MSKKISPRQQAKMNNRSADRNFRRQGFDIDFEDEIANARQRRNHFDNILF